MKTLFKNRVIQTQTDVDHLADFTWRILTDIFCTKKITRPSVFLFLSPASKGSLSSRTAEEKEIVHSQQRCGEGITLKFPPLAYVSQIGQVPEETAHLFTLVHQEKPPPRKMTFFGELRMTILHEAFGRFASLLIFPSQQFEKIKRSKSLENIWEEAHIEGYFLGNKLAQLYWRESLDLEILRKIFKFNWHDEKKNKIAEAFLYRLAGSKPKPRS